MPIEFETSSLIPASPEVVYNAWLDSEQHGKMTGAMAQASAVVGEPFEAWDGYISGKNLELEPGVRILQAWRTVEFEDRDPDSILEILLEPAEGGTKIILRHSNLPPHGMQYEKGWDDSYFQPMKAHFGD